jgi:excisionase family DNA binding protein
MIPEQRSIQLLNLSPEELKKEILTEIKAEIKSLESRLQTKGPEEYLTRAEVAELLKISLPTVSDWSKKGILKPYRLGKKVLFKLSEIDDALNKIQN